jgi:HAD superfamily hydrolase (TIGR01509 family)
VITAIVFDCDGVLFDSWRANVAFYNAVLERAGLPPMDADWERRAHTMASAQIFEGMFGADPALLARVRATAHATDYAPFYDLMQPMARLHETLEELQRGYRLGMASNRGRTAPELVERFGLARYFGAVLSVLDVEHPKPHPGMLLACFAKLGVEPAEALYVGDAPSDLEAARAAGAEFVAVGDQGWAPRRIDRLEELPRSISALASQSTLPSNPSPSGRG